MAGHNAQLDLGHATLEPSEGIVAGSYGTWRLTYVIGSGGVARGGHIRISTDTDTDWAIPQFQDAAADDYTMVKAPKGASITTITQGYGALFLTVAGRALRQGDRVVVTYGDRTGGSRGTRSQTSYEKTHIFLVSVDVKGDGRFAPISDCPHVAIIGGPPERLVAVAPSTIGVGVPFDLLIRAQDAWGNPSSVYRGTVALSAEGMDLGDDRCNGPRFLDTNQGCERGA